MKNMKKTLFALITLLLVTMVLFGCVKKAPADVPQNQGTQAGEVLPTSEATAVDTDLNQDAVDTEVADLEKDLENW